MVIEDRGRCTPAETFALRGYDAVQLAAAPEPARISQAPVDFACFDLRLNRASRVLALNAVSCGIESAV